ncbi:MAG: prepilin peptidase [Clostridiales bacterium]|nr:prepilin peptidase [Clostridiales bacterium]
MTVTSQTIVLTLIAAVMAVPAFFMFNKMPEAWLQDYDFDPKAENVRWAKRLKPYHIAVFAAIYAVLVFISTAMYPEFLSFDHWLRVAALLLAFPGFTIIIMSDTLNRIIPDHIIVLNIILSLLYFVSDFVDGNIWIDVEKPWYYLVLNRVIAALVGSGALLLLGIISSAIAKTEAMGMGDVKLLFLCGLLSGLKGLIFVVFIAFITAGVVAVPMLIRKRMRIAEEERQIRESPDPAKARKILAKKKREMHFADDPDYLAFGPFLILGTVLFLLYEPYFLDLFNRYFGPVSGAM